MTNEEKQALIDHIQTELDVLRYVTLRHADECEREDVQRDIRIQEIALAALTAQPVDLPDVRIFCNSNKSHRKVIYAMTDAIRAAGYEVQE